MSNSHSWLQIAEYVFIAGSVVGSVVAVVSGQVIYALVPVCVSLLLNAINRRRFEQQTRRRTKVAISRMHQQLSADIQSLRQQVAQKPQNVSLQVKEAIAALRAQMSGSVSQGEFLDLVPLYEKLVLQKRLITSLQEQYGSLEESLKRIIDYLNSSSLPPRVDYLEKAIAQLSQGIATIPIQFEEIDQQLKAVQVQAAQAFVEPQLPSIVAPSPPEEHSDPSWRESQQVVPPSASVERSQVLQSQSWSCVRTLQGHSDWTRSLAISPDGQTLVSGSFDNTIKLWSLSEGELINTLSDHSKGVFSVAISPDGQIVASGSWDETIKLWRMDTGELIHTLSGHSGSVRSLAISGDGQILVSGSFDKTIKLWRMDTGELIGTWSEYDEPVYAIALSPDAGILASGGDEGLITLWRLNISQPIGFLSGNLSCVYSLAISQDGHTIAAGCVNGVITLWQLDTGEIIGALQGHLEPVTSTVFSPDGQNLISGSADGTIKIWHLESDRRPQESPLQVLTDDSASSALSIAISPDGGTLAVGHADGTIKIWQCY